jgi:hypothetical protein
MTVAWAHFLTALTIIAAGALVATIIVSFLPAQRRTAWTVLAIISAAIGSVAFGTGIAETLPGRIIATHVAADTLAEVTAALPELAELSEADPMVRYEIASAFHASYMARDGSEQARATRAGYRMGLVVQRVHLRHLTELSDQSARRLIAIERQILEEQVRADSTDCGLNRDTGQSPDPAMFSPRLQELRRAELRAKLYALIDRADHLPTFSYPERRAFETTLKAQENPAILAGRRKGNDRCTRLLAFYAVLEQQPLPMQGNWVRSRQIFLAGS